MRRLLEWFNALVGLVFASTPLGAGLKEIVHLHAIGMLTESDLDLPLWQVRLVLPIAAAFYALYFIGNMIALWRGEDPEEAASG